MKLKAKRVIDPKRIKIKAQRLDPKKGLNWNPKGLK